MISLALPAAAKPIARAWLVLAALAFAGASAQTPPAQESPSSILAKIQSDKRAVVAAAMDLTPEEASQFWPLYEKFQRELDTVNRKHSRAVLDYVAAEGKLTGANAERLTRELLDANVEDARLRQRQYAALKKALPAAKVARYMQVENKIQAIKRYELAKAIPLAE